MVASRAEELTRSRLSDQIALSLLRSIVVGGLPAGQVLPTESDLCEEFAVSRTVVREAVRVLASKGLVRVKQGKGMWVAPTTNWDPLDADIMRARSEHDNCNGMWRTLREARRVFETGVAGLAAERGTATDLAALSDAVARMRSAARTGDRKAYRIGDVDFHRCLVRAAHNPVLERILEPISTF